MAATEIKVQMQQRRDTAAGWTSANPTLLSGEFGYETDSGKFKIGDGTTAWNSLGYIAGFSISSYPLATADIADDAITADKLANTSVTAGSYTAADITVDAQGRITAAASGEISTAEIADDAVTADKLADTAVTAGSYTAANITVDAQGRITAAASGTIGTSELADDSVTGDKLANDITIANDLTVTNNLTVNGTTTTINSTTLQVDDKNIELGTVTTPTDTTANGGGITLKGTTDHTIIWTDSTDSWDFSEHVNIASGKEFQIAGTSVLSASTLGSGVTASSLTSVGTITTGTWNGTAIDAAYLDSTVVTTGDTGTVTSTMISDGTIVDADINASAAIAGTKIDADFGAQDLTVDTNVFHVDATNDRVGIGTSSPECRLQIGDSTVNSGNFISFGRRVTSAQTNKPLIGHTSDGTNSDLGLCATSSGGAIRFFTGDDAAGFGTGSNDERMRITSDGVCLIGKTVADTATAGCLVNGIGTAAFSRSGSSSLILNRVSSDGNVVLIKQDDVEEGTISVSGTTVSYNGGHLSRWSQLAGGAERVEILRGSVLSNLDEMCEWDDEDNEQLNRMKVSDVKGDVNVAGVFQSWDDDDNTYINDFFCAMTGDFVIRIAQGTTVARGDLLMSAGDGTAKPQDDDIIRSKTIAKVTSTVVSETYADGSYCVPCVLMAC